MAVNNIDVSTLTISSTSIGLSDGSPALAAVLTAGAKTARIVFTNGSVYWRDDGDDATSADEVAYQDDALEIFGESGESMRQILNRLRFLRVSGDVITVIHYYN